MFCSRTFTVCIAVGLVLLSQVLDGAIIKDENSVLRRRKRDMKTFQQMVGCALGDPTIFPSLIDYGCYCRAEHPSVHVDPVDDIDTCCKEFHDCHANLVQNPFKVKYETKPCENNKQLCLSAAEYGETVVNGYSAAIREVVCLCDYTFSQCVIGKSINDSYKNGAAVC